MILSGISHRVGPSLVFVLCFLALSAHSPILEAQGELVRHSLDFQQRHNQYVKVTLQLPVKGSQLELAMPSWTPGSYVIRDFAAHMEKFQATDPDGRRIDVEKVAKNRWRMVTEGITELTVSYDVWAGELHVSSSWIESGFALLNGAGIFLYSADSLDWPQEVIINLPESWGEIQTSLEPLGAGNRFRASDYHELVDSPIVAGNVAVHRFVEDHQGYVLVNAGETEFWDHERAVQDLGKIVETQQQFWNVNPFDRDYLFLNFLLEYKGGLEHDHSTVMMSSRWAMRNRLEYIKWLALVSHEFFHSWNVRRMRPEALVNYDYDNEVYTHELWLAEGLSSYYDNLLLLRSGLIEVNEYFDLLESEFRNYETVPGREVVSAELASFDSWIKHYVPDANSVNSTVSYYRKGVLIGFVTDAAIRRETGSKASLDSVMRRMYELYGPDGPGNGSYPPGAFENLVEEAAGPGVRAMVDDLLRTIGDPDIDEALEWYGLKLDRMPARSSAEKAGTPAPAGIGVTWKSDDKLLIVENVLRGRPAATAGVIPGDELLAINGLRVLPGTVNDRILRLRPGEQVQLTMVRHGQLLTVPVLVDYAIPENYVITSDDKISRREQVRLEKWLGIQISVNQ